MDVHIREIHKKEEKQNIKEEKPSYNSGVLKFRHYQLPGQLIEVCDGPVSWRHGMGSSLG